MASSLPPEIWFSIIKYLPGNEQLQVSQVSPQLCAVARKIIYRDVELRSNHVAVEATLALLIRDHSLARNVRRLHIYTDRYTPKEPPWFDSTVLTGMTNLRRLDVAGMPFRTEENHLKFNKVVSESLPSLRQLEYVSLRSGFRKIYWPEKHVPVLQISGLQKITWIDPDTFIHPLHIFNPINASRETLTHIRIPEHHSRFANTKEHFIHFFTLRFPHLSTLQLGGWDTVASVDAALTDFLIAHPLIQNLNLGFSDHDRSGIHCHLSPDATLAPGILPNLRRLTVDASNLDLFARSRISSLQKLESLHIGVGLFEEVDVDIGFADMCRALEANGGLPGLKVLELELQGLGNELENAAWIVGLGKLCPNVEWFWGDYEVGIAAAITQDIFTSYAKLKSLMLPDTDHRSLRRRDRVDHVKEVVAYNPSVTNLRFYKRNDAHIIMCHYRMARDMSGRITAMVEVLDDGAEIVWI